MWPVLSPSVPAEPEPAQPAQSKTGKYVPPSLRDGSTRRGESMQPNRRGECTSVSSLAVCTQSMHSSSCCTTACVLLTGISYIIDSCMFLPPTADDNATIRVTNLSEDTRETDLQELFRPFGSISRIYLAKDKNTGQSKVIVHLNNACVILSLAYESFQRFSV